MRAELLRFNGAVERDPAIDVWIKKHADELGPHQWLEVMRKCGDEVREFLYDGCPVVCLGDVPFGYVNVFHLARKRRVFSRRSISSMRNSENFPSDPLLNVENCGGIA